MPMMMYTCYTHRWGAGTTCYVVYAERTLVKVYVQTEIDTWHGMSEGYWLRAGPSACVAGMLLLCWTFSTHPIAVIIAHDVLSSPCPLSCFGRWYKVANSSSLLSRYWSLFMFFPHVLHRTVLYLFRKIPSHLCYCMETVCINFGLVSRVWYNIEVCYLCTHFNIDPSSFSLQHRTVQYLVLGMILFSCSAYIFCVNSYVSITLPHI